ncbi:MAG: oxidoreductase [Alphaproteobacteria bacterium]|nr:oxidoreductase [Alphaproteobacteria bacterium]MDE1985258.1 oxidoreductase [Alphaproteobacteria bacterium]MDE2266882.1 oxidoreductase [Alphaproteobacteria bacterium]
MTQTLNVALIGYGVAGRCFHAPLIISVEGLRLAAVVSRQTDKVRADHPEAAVLATPDEAFADCSIDVVVVAATNDVHFDLAARALDHGKHVVVDKPFTVTSAEARELIRRAKDAGRILSVFHNRRWDSDYLTVKRLIAEGELGEIVYFESHFDRYRPKSTGNWREQSGPASGLWFDLAPHLADQALRLFGRPHALFADFAILRDGVTATDYFHVLLRYEKLRVVLTANFLAPADDLNLIVHGTRASYIKRGFDSQEAVLRAGGSPGGPQWGVDQRDGVLRLADGTERTVPSERGDYTQYYAGVRDAILGTGLLPVTPEEALDVMDILECGERSAASHAEVPVMAGTI